MDKRGKSIYAFVDAANLFYGGEKSLHWRIDYEKLIKYLREKFLVTKVFYYAGVDVDQYKAEEGKRIDLNDLVKYFEGKLLEKDKTEADIVLLEKQLERAKFYLELKKYGYNLRIKPTKVFTSAEGTTTTKANCDVDLTFDMMRFMSQYNEVVVLSGDGDFAPILEYLKNKKKKIRVLARIERTAREMRELTGDDFVDFKSIRKEIEAEKEKVENLNRSRINLPSRQAGFGKAERHTESKKKKVPVFRKGF
ncbi:MAG TPA: NYN domain-containing protein [Spirochaetia bacterium]|nr:NYN domain-containing protein [Spirochaetia bacterium]